jgi:hypothetical protein
MGIRGVLTALVGAISLLVGPLLLGAPPEINSADLPAFAKSVLVTVDGDRVSLEDAIRRATADERVVAYRQMRAEAGNTSMRQLQLARWCRKQKFADEERLHWQLLLLLQPGHPDAIKGLGLRNFHGQLLTKDEIEQAKKEAKAAKEAERKWRPKLKQIKLALSQDDAAARQAALDELEAIRDPQAMPLVEKMFADASTDVALVVVEMYARAVKQQSTDALVRLSIHAKDAAVREKAASELRYRPMESYMPSLVGALAAPIELSLRGDVERGGATAEWWNTFYYTGRLVQCGMYGVIRLDGNYTERDMVYWWGPETKPFSGWLITGYIPDHHQVDYVLSRDSPDPNAPYEFRGSFESKGSGGPNAGEPESIRRSIAALEKRILEINDAAVEMNLRIDAAIREATNGGSANGLPPKVEKAVDVRPRLWWAWWQKRLNLNNYFDKRTEVWTQLGVLPIEQVLVGDRVLTKNLDTGELTFNLVIGIDTQPERDATVVDVGGRTIVATTDQPFFVPADNWRAATELKPGVQVESLAGPRRIESIRSGTAEVLFSLLVANSPNYFVERQGILVHDATRP